MLQKAIDKEYKETNKANIFVWYILFLAFFYFYECPFFFSKKCRNKNSNASKTNQDNNTLWKAISNAEIHSNASKTILDNNTSSKAIKKCRNKLKR